MSDYNYALSTADLLPVKGNTPWGYYDNDPVFQTDAQKSVLSAAANNLGEMGSLNLGGNGGVMNPAGMMTGMIMGGAMGNQMAGMMSQMGNNMNAQMQSTSPVPPPPPLPSYYLALNGQQNGPYTISQLKDMVLSGQFQQNSYVWKHGMQNWEEAGKLLDLQNLFNSNQTPPPLPII
jgi:hypothetical protein